MKKIAKRDGKCTAANAMAAMANAIAAVVVAVVAIFAFAGVCGCSESGDGGEGVNVGDLSDAKVYKVAFRLGGDVSIVGFDKAAATRAGLEANGKELTDLWVFDYKDGECVQKLHQANTESGFGNVAMTMNVGRHTVYFVASRGDGANIDESGHVITWGKVSDTFWSKCEVDVSKDMGVQNVSLERVVTMLKLTVTDKIQENAASIVAVPGSWYYGLDYLTGDAASVVNGKETKVDVPAGMIGKENIAINFYGFSGVNEWKTDVKVKAVDDNGKDVAGVELKDVPFVRNRQTVYKGRLFSQDAGFAMDVKDTWEDEWQGEW